MRVDHHRKQEQMFCRLENKTAEADFKKRIVEGTNCSPFESEIIARQAQETFHLGQYEDRNRMLDGQMVFQAVSQEEPPGKPIADCRLVRCVLTHIHRVEDMEVRRDHGLAAKRRQQIIRMAVEAKEQGALLTQEDLALILDCDEKTIRKDIRALAEQDVITPTRGAVRDIGPGMTHKQQAIRLWAEGYEPLEVARRLNHSLKAVERYVHTFARVVYGQRHFRDILKTALVVGISVAGANAYMDIHVELKESGHTGYAGRLAEVERVGQLYWETSDEKKSPSPKPKPRRREARQ